MSNSVSAVHTELFVLWRLCGKCTRYCVTNKNMQLDTTYGCGVHTRQGIPQYGTTILERRDVAFSMNVLLRGQWQWGGTPTGLSVKLTQLGHPHNHQDFQYKTGHYWLQRNGILARFDYLDHLPFKAPRPFETSGITHTHTHSTPQSHIPLDLSPSEDPSSNLMASHLIKILLALRKWAFVSAFTKTGPLDCLQAHTHTLFF